MAKVKAAYNYSYNYEGKKISFKKDEEFQLLTKSNKDWWQVRRWMEGAAQDIYVPAVYVREVEEPAPCPKEVDATYMNLDDLKMNVKQEEGNEKGGGVDVGGGVASVLKVLNKPKSRDSFKRATHTPIAKKDVDNGNKPEGNPENGVSSTINANGLNPSKPVSPTILRRFNRGGGMGLTNPPASVNTGVLAGQPKQDGTGAVSSLKRGDKLFPPQTSTKPRSKSGADTTGSVLNLESSLDARHGGGLGARAPATGPVPKGKPPPVHIKPKPQKLQRPCSYVGGDHQEIESNSKPLVSELSNILLKKKPHLSDHKQLTASRSAGIPETSSQSFDRHANQVKIRSECLVHMLALCRSSFEIGVCPL